MVTTKSYQQETRLFLKEFNLHEATKLFNAVMYEKILILQYWKSWQIITNTNSEQLIYWSHYI